MINKLKKMKFVNLLTFDAFFAILFAFCLCLKTKYIINPFYIPFLLFFITYSLKSFAFFCLTSLLVSYLQDYNLLIFTLYIISICIALKVFFNFFVRQKYIKKYGSYIVLTSLTYSYVAIKYHEYIFIFYALLFSFFMYISLLSLLDNLKYNYKINNINRIVLFLLLPLCFTVFNVYYFLILRILHLLYLKAFKEEESLLYVSLSSIYSIYLFPDNKLIIISLLLPSIICLFFNYKYRLFSYLMSYVIYEMAFLTKFYQQVSFYEGLIAMCFVFIIPTSFYEFVDYKLYFKKVKDDDFNLINNIKDYLGVALSRKLEFNNYNKEIFECFENNLCANCSSSNTCSLTSLKKKSIISNINKDEKKQIINNCETPYKFFKNSKTMKDIYLQEQKKAMDAYRINKGFENELRNIYTPLLILDTQKKDLNKTLFNLCLEEELPIYDIIKQNDELHIKVYKFNQYDIQTYLKLIMNVYQKTCYFVKSIYSFSSGGYLLMFSFESLYDIDYYYSFSSYEANTCGDYVKIYFRDNKFFLLLSDGMGHDKYSSKISEYLVELITSFSKLNGDYFEQIKTANEMIYNKSSKESYATLDYFIIDLVDLNFSLFKAGSFPTYIYHNHEVKESKKNFAPLGIINNVSPFRYQDKLNEEDVLVFLSDGFKNDVYDIINTTLLCNAYLSSKEIHDLLLDNLNDNDLAKDDRTLVVLKIKKRKIK